jgi:hypothetical protein
VKRNPIIWLALLAFVAPATLSAETWEPTRWTVTLAMMEALSEEERQFILDTLGIDLSIDVINQAIAEGQVPLEAFGGE